MTNREADETRTEGREVRHRDEPSHHPISIHTVSPEGRLRPVKRDGDGNETRHQPQVDH